jgi:hypothetical protein
MTGLLALQMKLILQVFFTLAVFSFLYRDSPIYRFAEHAFVGVATGYAVVVQFHTVLMPNLVRPLRDEGIRGLMHGKVNTTALLLVIPGALGIMIFFKFFSDYGWIARWPMAVVIGYYSGAAIVGSASGDLVPQVQANVIPMVKAGAWGRLLAEPGLFTLLDVLYNPILIVGTLCCLVYFFFSKEHKGATGSAATLGIWFLMVSFGASYGSTVMTRVSLFLERAYFLLKETTPLPGGGELANWKVTAVILALVLAFLVVHRIKAGPEMN